MSTEFKDVLKKIIDDHGIVVALDQDKCEQILEEYFGDNKFLYKMLLLAQREGIPSELLNNKEVDFEALYQKLFQKLDSLTGLGEKHGALRGFSVVTVKTWAYALGLPFPKTE